MKKQSGFTLIEIVMVLVLLGILSAVAVPKYFDLQAEAKQRAAQAAIAEAQARVNALFAEAILKGEKCSEAVTMVQADSAGTLSDFVNGKTMSNWTVKWVAGGPGETPAVEVYEGSSDTAMTISITGYTPQIVLPNCK